RRVVTDVFTATERVLREVMTPRTEVEFLPGCMPLDEAVDYVAGQPHSRYPVIGHSPDEILGMVHVRDVLTATHREHAHDLRTIADLTRKMPMLPGSLPLVPALARMRRRGH